MVQNRWLMLRQKMLHTTHKDVKIRSIHSKAIEFRAISNARTKFCGFLPELAWGHPFPSSLPKYTCGCGFVAD